MPEFTVLYTSGSLGDTWHIDSWHETRRAAKARADQRADQLRHDYIAVVGASKACRQHSPCCCFIVDTRRVRVPVAERHLRGRSVHASYDDPLDPDTDDD